MTPAEIPEWNPQPYKAGDICGNVILAAATAVVGLRAAAILDMKTGYFECPHCKELFVPSVGEYLIGCHTFTKRRLT